MMLGGMGGMGGMGGIGGIGVGTMGMGGMGMGHYGPQGGNPMDSYVKYALLQSLFKKNNEEVGEEGEESSGMNPYTMMMLMGGMGGMGMGGMGMGGMGIGGL